MSGLSCARNTFAAWAPTAAAILLVGCNFVSPGNKPTKSPDLGISGFDWNDRSLRDFTGARGTPHPPQFPWAYNGLWKYTDTAPFSANIGVRALDPSGVHSLAISYSFYTCGDFGTNPISAPLTSFNNGATTGQSGFSLTGNSNPATTELAFPVTITTTDLQTVACPNGKHSSGLGTIVVNVTATNFSADPNTRTTLGQFDIQIGNSPLPNP